MNKCNVFLIASTLCVSTTATAEDSVQPPQVEAPHVQVDPIPVHASPQTGYAVEASSSATRTDTPIKQIPQSVHVIPRQLVDDQQNVTVSEALNNVSNVVTNAEFSSPAFETTRIRGFAAEQLLDGFTQYYNPGDRQSLVNIQKLEVLKGSNAVLFGGGSGAPVGGVVNIVSKLPHAKASGEFGIKIGTDNFAQPFFDVNQPLSENILFRITGEYTHAESNVDVLEQRRYNINPSLTLTNNETTTLTLQGKMSRWRQQDYQGLPATGTVTGSFRTKPELFIGHKDLPDSTSEFDGVWATLDHKINNIWSINLKARYAEAEFDEKTQLLFTNRPDIAPSTWFFANTRLYQEQKEKSGLGNATAKFDLGATKNTLLIGADYSELEDIGFMNADIAGMVNLSNPVFSVPYTDPVTPMNDARIKNRTYGAYAQLQSTIHDRLHLLAGLRQAHVDVTYDERTVATKVKTTKNDLLPRIGGVFDINNSFSLFASYSEGLRGQPYKIFATGVTPRPETSRSKEAGIKFDLDGQLTGQVAYFNIDRSNIAVGFPSTPTSTQRSRGFDADVTWQPTRAWSLLGAYAHTQAKFTNNVSATVIDGNRLSGIPKNSARIWAKYAFQQESLRGLSAGIGAYWQSKAFIDDANLYESDSYHTIDAALNYETPRFHVGLTVKNLTNEDYYQYYNYFGGRVKPDAGTATYLSVAVKY